MLVVEGTKRMSKQRKNKVIFVRADERLKGRLKLAADALDGDVSKLVRDAVVEKLARLCVENKDVARALRAVA